MSILIAEGATVAKIIGDTPEIFIHLPDEELQATKILSSL